MRGALHASTNFGPQGQERQIDYAVCVFVGLDWSGRRFAWLDRKQRASSTDKRTLKHQGGYDRERFKKEMANPKERSMREAAKRDAPKGSKASIETDKDRETKEAIRHFNEARQKESEPLSPQPSG